MLPGLDTEQFHRLLLSVGQTSSRRRPLSPVEVGQLCQKAIGEGASRQEVTHALSMTDTSMITKFLRLAELAPEIQHVVSWGRSTEATIGFSVASQLARMAPAHHVTMATSILQYALTKTEMISIIQLLERSGDSLEKCRDRVLRRRPIVRERHLLLGAVASNEVASALARLTQRERDAVLTTVLAQEYPDAADCSAKLGVDRFTIVGTKHVARAIAGAGDFESRITAGIASVLRSQPS